ncbi:MAG: TrkH family potassium uptake protein [Bacillota bacterium]|nr:TrkH family potassium uptake protein [Bacillota bacterium]
MNRRFIFYTLGKIMEVLAAILLIPMLVGFIYQEKAAFIYLGVAIATFIAGYIISRKKPIKTKIFSREGFVIVAFTWILVSLIGALPYTLSGDIPSYIDAVFETVSGFTTTGSSILPDIEALNQCNLFWRAFTHWIGGMGILVFVVAILPESQGNTLHILKAEIPGPVVGKLVSKIKITARILYYIYAALTLAEVVFLLLGGMPLFDSITTAFATAGTGGFSCRGASIAAYNSAYIDYVVTIFMILFGINFNLYFYILIRRAKLAFGSEELHWYLGIILTVAILITFNTAHLYESILTSFRYAIFQVASIITTTGFITYDYTKWPQFSQFLLMLLMFVGASAGSTGGGIKISRIIIFFKSGISECKKALHPHAVTTVQFEGKNVEKNTISSIHNYFALYILIFAISLILISFNNLDFASSFSAVSTCLNNVGPGLGVVGPVDNFASLADFSKIILSFDMLAGRLEIFPILLLFSKQLWVK